MRVAVLVHPPVLEIADRPDPLADAGEAVVEVSLAGVCGTDLALVSGDYPVALPLVPGHEFVGRVVATGSPGDSAWVGRRVTAEINNTCRATRRGSLCEACRRGLDHHCLTRTVTGIVGHDGAFAERVVVHVGVLHALPDGLEDREAVFVEPVAAALQTFEMAPLGSGESVVVLGAGRLGILVAGVASRLGARVLPVARSQATRARVERFLGLRCASSEPLEALAAEVREWTGGLGADRVVEATGTGDGEALALAARLVRPGGIIDLKSTPGAFSPGIPLTTLVVNEIRLQGSRCGPFDRAIAFLADHPFPLSTLVAEEYPLAEANRAIERAHAVSKVLIRCAR